MQLQLTEPELAFIADIVTSYKNKRDASIAKSTNKSPSAELETATLAYLIIKLEVMHSQAVATDSKVIVPMTKDQAYAVNIPMGEEGKDFVITDATE